MPKKPTHSAIDVAIGRRMRAQRLSLSMSQTELGDAMGVTFQQVQKYEKGSNGLNAARLMAAARALEMPVLVLMCGDDADTAETAGIATTMMATRDGAKLATAFNAIGSADSRAAIIRITQQVAATTQAAGA